MHHYLKICMLVAAVSALQADVIEKTYHFSAPVISGSGDNQTISFKNTMQKGVIGEPSLPYTAVSLMLPPGEEARSVRITYNEMQQLQGTYRLPPVQPSRRFSGQTGHALVRNETVYQADAVYPAAFAPVCRTAYMNGVSVALSAFTPVRYNPAEVSVTYYSDVTVSVETGPAVNSAAVPALLRNDQRDRISRFVQNPALLENYPSLQTAAGIYEVLVITGSEYTDSFDDLLYHYALRGLRGEIISTASIESDMEGADLQEKIRNCIIREYQTRGIIHVLLAGDEEIIPSRRFYCYVESGSGVTSQDIPADIYYSALDGTWNTNGDPFWGEVGEDDLLPDVSVGRLPFSNKDDLERMLHKIFKYQTVPVTGELRDPLLAGEKAWDNPLSWGADYLELLVGNRSDNGYTTVGIPESHDITTLYDRDVGSWSAGNIIAAMNEGHSYLYHSGHSNTSYNMRLSIYDIVSENFTPLDGLSHNYLNIYSHGCNSGGFDASDCIGEHMILLDNFAVSYIGNSRFGWFNEGQTEGPSLHLNREFISALYGEQVTTIGEAHMISKAASAPWVNAPNQHEDGALRWCFYACNVLGDPAMPVWTDEPIDVDADYALTFNKQDGQLQVLLTSGGAPLAGYMCVLMQDSVLYGRASTDAGGTALVDLNSLSIQDGNAVLVVSGYNRPPLQLPLTITAVDDGAPGYPRRPELTGSFPNPFNLSTSIRFTLPAEAEVSLRIYNLRGQQVAALVDGYKNGGTHTVTWDGRGRSGSPVESGVYLCRLESGGFSETLKLMLVK